ncbi:MAG: hypothetical protein AAFX79_09565 [Planctomycetota bacterium]
MRRIVDALAMGLCVVVLVLALVGWARTDTTATRSAQTLLALDRFHTVLKLQANTPGVEVNGRGWPITVEAWWFGKEPPRNQLLSGDRPWVEIAPIEHADRMHPDDPVAFDEDGVKPASFWYNPYRGVVRARVAPQINAEATLLLYNEVNDVALVSLSRDAEMRREQAALDEASQLREMADRVRELAETTGAISTSDSMVRVRRADGEDDTEGAETPPQAPQGPVSDPSGDGDAPADTPASGGETTVDPEPARAAPPA